MSLAKKLNLKDGETIRLVNPPRGAKLDLPASPKGDAVLVFTTTMADVTQHAKPAIEAAKKDQLSWIAYPKAGQLGTDLNRDILWKHLLKQDIQGVRQVALDDVWSAIRFRPKKG